MIESAVLLAALTEAGEPPTELRMFAFGENATSKGTFVLDRRGAESVMAAFAKHGVDRLPIDVAHGMLASGGSHEQHLAVGWFVPDVRDDGLWASSIEWTERGADMVRAREMRFISPAFLADKKGRIVEMINLAVTNLPATRGAQPIAASQGVDDMSDKTIRIALGLADDADVGEAVTALANDRAVLLAALEAHTVEAAVGNYRAAKARVTELEAEKASVALAAKLDAAGLQPGQRAFAETLSNAQLDQYIALCAAVTAPLKQTVMQKAAAGGASDAQIDRAIATARARGITLSRDDAARQIAEIQAAYRAETGAR